jgi:hypothetical protein
LTLSAVTNRFDLNGFSELTGVCGALTVTNDPNLPTGTAEAFLGQRTSPTCKGTPTAIRGDLP